MGQASVILLNKIVKINTYIYTLKWGREKGQNMAPSKEQWIEFDGKWGKKKSNI